MSSHRKSPLILGMTFVIAALLGWLLGRDATSNNEEIGSDTTGNRVRTTPVPFDPPNAPSKSAREQKVAAEDNEPGAIPNERLIRFGSEEAYRDFLASLDGTGLRLLGKLDRYRTVRVGYDDLGDLRGLLDDNAEEFPNFLVLLPDIPDATEIPITGTGFGASVLAWLGITGDNSSYGSGQIVAVIDTGFTYHSSLGQFTQIDLVGDDIPFHPHGNSIGSLIGGSDSNFTGLAPDSQLLSVRIGNEYGASNSFLLAEGILAAVENGADIINISMGSESNSQIVQNAINDAIMSGAVVVASAGNNGQAFLSYPAGNEGVISVGSIEAGRNQLGFSHTSDSLSVTAPGLEIMAAGSEGYGFVTGTSSSAAIVSGALAATASNLELPIADSWIVIQNNLDEAGPPGPDPYYGNGILNMERVLNSNTSGIYDMALVNPYYEPASGSGGTDYLHFTAENRGTERVSSELYLITSRGEIPINLGSLAPNEISTYSLPIDGATDTLSINARVEIPANLTDSKQSNDRAVGTLSRAAESE